MYSQWAPAPRHCQNEKCQMSKLKQTKPPLMQATKLRSGKGKLIWDYPVNDYSARDSRTDPRGAMAAMWQAGTAVQLMGAPSMWLAEAVSEQLGAPGGCLHEHVAGRRLEVQLQGDRLDLLSAGIDPAQGSLRNKELRLKIVRPTTCTGKIGHFMSV